VKTYLEEEEEEELKVW
jgi:hypothetical protein